MIGAGVSNWACYAICVVLQNLSNDDDLLRYLSKGLGSENRDNIGQKGFLDFDVCRKHLVALENYGVKDGPKPDQKISVDGMKFDEEHKQFIEKLNAEFIV